MESLPYTKDLKADVKYFKHQRDLELNELCKRVRSGDTFERITNTINSLIRKQKHLILVEDALVIYRLTNK